MELLQANLQLIQQWSLLYMPSRMELKSTSLASMIILRSNYIQSSVYLSIEEFVFSLLICIVPDAIRSILSFSQTKLKQALGLFLLVSTSGVQNIPVFGNIYHLVLPNLGKCICKNNISKCLKGALFNLPPIPQVSCDLKLATQLLIIDLDFCLFCLLQDCWQWY